MVPGVVVGVGGRVEPPERDVEVVAAGGAARPGLDAVRGPSSYSLRCWSAVRCAGRAPATSSTSSPSWAPPVPSRSGRPPTCAPSPRRAVARTPSTGRYVQEASSSPRAARATWVTNEESPRTKLEVPSTGSTIQTGASPSSAPSSAGSACTASSPMTAEPGSRRVSVRVRRSSTRRSATVTRSSGPFFSSTSPSARRPKRASASSSATVRMDSSTAANVCALITAATQPEERPARGRGPLFHRLRGNRRTPGHPGAGRRRSPRGTWAGSGPGHTSWGHHGGPGAAPEVLGATSVVSAGRPVCRPPTSTNVPDAC